MKPLLQPIKLGSIELKNRIIMSPLTRCRASGSDGRTPNDLMTEYYIQRASAGLIITEATAISPMGVGYPNTPGIWSEEHVAGWKKITDAVHAKGGKIVLQLWHVGRVSHPLYLDGKLPVAPSAIAPTGNVSLVRPPTAFVTPRALELSEIPGIVADYKKAAQNAKLAGFDGVEIHGANGYLLDQFLQDKANHRTDQYGGPIENRARLLLEVTDVCIEVWGADRVGVHLAPRSGSHSVGDSNLEKTFSCVAQELGKRKIAFICAREFEGPDSLAPKLKKLFNGPYIGNEKFTFATSDAAVARGDYDAIAFGNDYISNPDLVERYTEGKPLNELNKTTIYAQGAEGYTDYPTLRQES